MRGAFFPASFVSGPHFLRSEQEPAKDLSVFIPGKCRGRIWRRGWESNPRMEVLQTSPLGHLGTAPQFLSIANHIAIPQNKPQN